MDLYRDFAYCRLAAELSAVATDVLVDTTEHLPSNAELASGEFWMTIESTLALGGFEIVRVASHAGSMVTLVRGQQGTATRAHASGTVVKHALTAEMLGRLVALAQQGSGYRRFVDLGNPPTIVGSSTVDSEPNVLRGVAAGQSGGATVVAGALVTRGLEAAALGGTSTSVGDLTVTQVVDNSSESAGLVGATMWGEA